MTALTAIDILIEPDSRLVRPARALNERLHAANSDGYLFDATHAPHVTMVHRYVATSDLERLFDAVKRLVDERQPLGVELVATGLSYAKIGDIGIMSLDVERSTPLVGLHDAVLELVAPFTHTGGTSAAFFRKPGDPEVMQATVQYVHDFVPKFSGASYRPHLTVGPGRIPFLDSLKAQPFARLPFAIEGIAVYQLGEYGAARKRLWGT